VAAVQRLAREVCELQGAFLQRLGKDPSACIQVPMLALLAHMLHRG
jgi:hypothetical protein